MSEKRRIIGGALLVLLAACLFTFGSAGADPAPTPTPAPIPVQQWFLGPNGADTCYELVKRLRSELNQKEDTCANLGDLVKKLRLELKQKDCVDTAPTPMPVVLPPTGGEPSTQIGGSR